MSSELLRVEPISNSRPILTPSTLEMCIQQWLKSVGLNFALDRTHLSQDKDVAEQPFYRHNTYRFMCKKLGHGSSTSAGGKAETLRQHQSKLPIRSH